MSGVFASANEKSTVNPAQCTVVRLLNENSMLIKAIDMYQKLGRAGDALCYQKLLHRNLLYLTELADSSVKKQLQEQLVKSLVPLSAYILHLLASSVYLF
ncbi:hypothetical protein AB6A40_011506 [Gnathostoma spinigerum]|uniref:SS18 N-terminal domain-containing protein n=1 Tax=Gnathostoma spinigerum TaxID=75299 RepID=A0ABD6F451_9BILA